MKLTFDISATEFETARDILADIVPPGCRVWVFGSRAKNQTRFNSDLDLALECKDKLPRIISHKLKEAFSDSLLPYRVDVLDINDVSKEFQTIIRQQAIAFPLTKSANVPKLRFPEFSGEWETKTLDELCSIQAGNFVKASDISPQKAEGLSRCYGGNGQRGYVSGYNREGRFSLIGRQGALCGNVHFVEGKFHATEHALVADAHEGEMADWLFHLLGRMNLNQYSTGLAQPGISAEVIKKIAAKAPTLPEQQKIASFLSAIDTKIAQLTKKKALLEQYKRGVMQKLFSQELRFKDAQGKAFPDWVEKRLSSLTKLITKGTTPTSVGFGFQKTGINFVKVESLDDRFNIIEQKLAKISTECHEDLKRSQIEDGDILFSIAGTLGRTAIARKKDIPANTNQAISIIRLRNAKAAKFVNYVLNSSAIRKRIRQILSVGAQPNLSLEQVGQFKIFLPVHQEQQKIAAFLSSIDQKIDLIATELNHAQTFKKGLMQQMFI